mmetsp:Transcript_28905/g.51672  ORF Transcript_28905/g.51672 Transcript_28905/m.51672 type:complete len:597 (-) Transcript_28905:259-2049(-)
MVPQLIERADAEPRPLDRLEELLGDDHVGVHVLNVQRRGGALEGGERGDAGRGRGSRRRAGARAGSSGNHRDEEGAGVEGARDGGGRQLPHVGQSARHSGGGGHRGAHQMGAPAVTLAALEISIGGGGAALAGEQFVGVHGEAHGAAGLAPVKARLDQNLVQPLLLRLLLHQSRAGHHHGIHSFRHAAARRDGRHLANVLDAAVGAGADEDLVHGDALQRRAGLQSHVLKGTLDGRTTLRVALSRRVGRLSGDGRRVLRTRAPGQSGRDVRGVDVDNDIIMRIRVAAQAAPVLHRAVPRLAHWRQWAALDVVKGDVVGRDQPRARARLDGHVADGHARLHGQPPDRLPCKLHHRAGAARGADLPDHVQHDVLRGKPGGQRPIHLDEHVLALLLQQSLRSQHVLHLRRADAKGESAKGAVGGSVAVAADAGGAGEGEALLRAHHVHDALARVVQREIGDAKLLHVVLQSAHLVARVCLLDELSGGGEGGTVAGGHVVIGDGEGAVGAAHGTPRGAQPLERLRAGHLVHQVAIDVQQRRAVLLHVHHMLLKDFVVHGLWPLSTDSYAARSLRAPARCGGGVEAAECGSGERRGASGAR